MVKEVELRYRIKKSLLVTLSGLNTRFVTIETDRHSKTDTIVCQPY
jgi:hypothetical protein